VDGKHPSFTRGAFVIPGSRSSSPPIGLSLLLPGFADTPYLSTRIEPDLHHILLLPRRWPLYSQLNVAFRQAEANRLPTYFVITPDTCLWMQPDGSVLPARAEARDVAVTLGKLAACEVMPNDADLVAREQRLRQFIQQQGGRTIGCDPARGGCVPSAEEAEAYRGQGEEGLPRGLERCPECGEWRGACLDPRRPLDPLLLPVCCPCDNDNYCAWCGEPLFERRLQCNWYDEEDRGLHYVPGFHALDHVCWE
jgi:hypothetical protein